MEIFNIKNLSFSYNKSEDSPTLKNISLSVDRGDFVLLIGESGSGKTTLLRMLKKELAPFGKTEGEIFFCGNKIENLSTRDSASKIGFVFQDPENQIVTDRVFTELAFGLENLGMKRESIRARVSEFAAYFGLSDCFESKCDELSGGQKQLLNLAAIMAMNPEVILLDEPLSMLDPISSMEFVRNLKRLNDDFSTTIIIAEHHLSELVSVSNKLAFLEDGELVHFGKTRDVLPRLKGKNIEKTLPAPVRLFNMTESAGDIALTVREGKRIVQNSGLLSLNISESELKTDVVLSVKDLWFRYSKTSDDVLKGFSMQLHEGEFFALVGANGCGKSTLLKLISSRLKPYRGKIKCRKKLGLLPQNPKDLFVCDKLEDDFKAVNNSYKEICDRFGISHLLQSHPFDLSGGELQRAALVKILLSDPDILLLDEPTKGLDVFAKEKLAEFLKSLGLTVLLVTHDLEFAAEYASTCALLFDGAITSSGEVHDFFSNNVFYTTQTAKMCRGVFDGGVKLSDLKLI